MIGATEELEATVEAALTKAGLDARTLEKHAGETIVPSELRVDTAAERAMSVLEELGASTLDRKLELHGTIGEGGMGIVRLARQLSLGRHVAVKSIKPAQKSERAVLKLLREAWVTGGLEHPNVVPVYDVALDADGAPLIVLKKIEGVDWATLMHDAATVRERFGAEDLLEWNLRIFMQVCNAVRFAHSRGVLHRDLKPENVMIGAFGEVYLVDWGIAVSLVDDGSGRLPLASEAREMAGTLLYMAPEMLGFGSPHRLSERTDVYLLGAILHEIVAGHPPHRGTSLMGYIASIMASAPALPDAVPSELAAIVRRAMDYHPDRRFESAEALRLAVQGFLQHRDAARLADRASERLRELLALLEAGGGKQPDDREAVYQLFGQCRFGFRHALEVWPGNVEARAALDRAIEAMVEHELALGEPEAARALLTEMEAVPPALAKRVAEARSTKEQDDARRRRLEEDLDPSKGRRTRSFVAIVMSVLWTGLPLVAQRYTVRHGTPPSPWLSLGVSVVLFGMLIGFGVWGRESLNRTAINRRIGMAAMTAIGLQIVARLVALQTGESLQETVHELFLVWTGIVVMLGAAVDRRLYVSAAGFMIAYAVTPMIGIDHVFYALSASNAVLLANVAVLWWRPSEDLPAARERMRENRAKRRRWLADKLDRHARRDEPREP
jgi:serine/threonine-protein kinase